VWPEHTGADKVDENRNLHQPGASPGAANRPWPKGRSTWGEVETPEWVKSPRGGAVGVGSQAPQGGRADRVRILAPPMGSKGIRGTVAHGTKRGVPPRA